MSTPNIQFYDKIRKNSLVNICFLELLRNFVETEKSSNHPW